MGNLALRRIEGNDSACRKTYAICVDSFEVIEPESTVHLCRIVFGQVQLRPAHGTVKPVGVGRNQRRAPPGEVIAKEAAAAVVCSKTLRGIINGSFHGSN